MTENNRFYFFETEKKKYYYDCLINKICLVSDEVYNHVKDKGLILEGLSEEGRCQLDKIIHTNPGVFPEYDTLNANITINYSNECNMNCTYCYRNKKDSKNMSKADIESLFDYIIYVYKPYARGYVISINLTGEPLLNLDTLKLFWEVKQNYMEKLNAVHKWIWLGFFTNGTLINDDVISFIKENGITDLTVSIDGPKELHDVSRVFYDNTGSYDKTVDGIKCLQQNGVSVSSSSVIIPEDPDLYKIVMHLKELNIKKANFQLLRTEGERYFSEDKLDLLFESVDRIYNQLFLDISNDDYVLFNMLKDSLLLEELSYIINRRRHIMRCNWGDNIIIDNKGDIYPCLYFIGNKDFYIANYKDGKKYEDISTYMMVDNQDGCKDCFARYLCGGSCHYCSYKENGNINGYSKLECKYRKYFIVSSLKFYIRLYESGLLANIKNKF